MRTLWLAVSCALLQVGCGKNTFKTASTCEKEAKETSTWLSALVAEGDGGRLARPEDFRAMASDAAPMWSDGWPHVALSVGSGTVDGSPVWKPSGNMKQLAHSVASRRALRDKLSGTTSPFWVSLEVDRRTKWKTVVEVLDALAGAGAAGVQLTFEAKSRLIEMSDSDAGQKLQQLIALSTKLPINQAADRPFTIAGSRSHATSELEAFVEKKRREYGEVEFISAGSSLKLCLVAEGRADIYPRTGPTMEWDTAAGQAVVEFSGAKVFKYDSEAPLDYNKENLLNPWFVVVR